MRTKGVRTKTALRICGRRSGDIAACYASPRTKRKKYLGWEGAIRHRGDVPRSMELAETKTTRNGYRVLYLAVRVYENPARR